MVKSKIKRKSCIVGYLDPSTSYGPVQGAQMAAPNLARGSTNNSLDAPSTPKDSTGLVKQDPHVLVANGMFLLAADELAARNRVVLSALICTGP
jgi:hypothetical protein